MSRASLGGAATWGTRTMTVSSAKEPKATSAVRRLTPRAQPLSAALLRDLSGADRRLVERRLSAPLECVYDPIFKNTDAENLLLGPAPERDEAELSRSEDSGADLLAPRPGTLSGRQERHLFLRLNYCRYRAMLVIREYRGKPLPAEAVREFLRWEHAAHNTRNDLVKVNVPLVLAMAKRTRITGVDYADLISEGNLALLRSVDKFDCARGFKFSTYACRSILKAFSRVATRTARHRGYFPTEFDPTLEKSDHVETRRETIEGECVDELKTILGRNLAKLNDVEEAVIRARFAIMDDGSPDAKSKTLEQVGEMIGVTKERVRQIQNKALDKLRGILEDGLLSK